MIKQELIEFEKEANHTVEQAGITSSYEREAECQGNSHIIITIVHSCNVLIDYSGFKLGTVDLSRIIQCF